MLLNGITALEEERSSNFKKLWKGEIEYESENPDSIVATPDGATFKSWAENPRPALISKDEA